jgi:hypothetical protein
MLHVRALIKADMIILFEPAGMRTNKLRDRLLWHMQANIKARRMGEEGKRAQQTAADGSTSCKEAQVDGDGRESMLEDGKRLSYEHR